MKQSDSISMLATAMCAAQSQMGAAVKDSINPFFANKGKGGEYADLTSVVKAIKEPFAENELSFVQFPHSSEFGAGVTTRLMHSSGEWLESEFVLPLGIDKDKNIKRDPQSAGAAITYARRYALAAMAGIPTADDDAESAMVRQITTPGYTPGQKDEFLALIAAGDGFGIKKFGKSVDQSVMDALFNSFKGGTITATKQKVRDIVQEANANIKATVAAIQEALAESQFSIIDEIYSEMTSTEREFVNTALSEVELLQIRNMKEVA